MNAWLHIRCYWGMKNYHCVSIHSALWFVTQAEIEEHNAVICFTSYSGISLFWLPTEGSVYINITHDTMNSITNITVSCDSLTCIDDIKSKIIVSLIWNSQSIVWAEISRASVVFMQKYEYLYTRININKILRQVLFLLKPRSGYEEVDNYYYDGWIHKTNKLKWVEDIKKKT